MSHIMRQVRVVVLLSIILLFLVPLAAQGKTKTLYQEKIKSYSRADGETFRWESKREFAIDDYKFMDINGTGFVNVSLIDSSNNGILHNNLFQMHKINFIPTIELWADGSLKNVNWQVTMFRIPKPTSEPFQVKDADILADSKVDHRRFDMFTEKTYFTLALETFEYHVINGEKVKLRVNTEFATDNYDDGLVYRTVLHIVKRTPNDDVVSDYTYEVEKANTVYRWFNLLDQPFLWVPLQLGSVFLLVFLYMKISRWYQNSGYKLVKESPEKLNGEPPKQENEKS